MHTNNKNHNDSEDEEDENCSDQMFSFPGKVIGYDFSRYRTPHSGLTNVDYLPKIPYLNVDVYVKTIEEFILREDGLSQNDISFLKNEIISLQNSKYRAILWDDFKLERFPEDRWRVPGLIPKAGFVILAGISGEGKSWFALELARCISIGENFLRTDRFKCIQGKVLYVDAENPRFEIQRRCGQLGFVDSDQFQIMSVDDLVLHNSDTAENFSKAIIEQKFKVVIIDTFRAVSGGLKEEKAEEVRTFFNRFKPLKDLDICVVWLDHYRKPAQHEGRIPKKEFLFGSQDKTASVEGLLMIKKDDSEISLYQRKNRIGLELNPFKIKIDDTQDEQGNVKTILSYIGDIDEKETKKEEAKLAIIEMLGTGPKTTSEIKTILQKEKKIGGRNVQDALKELVNEEEIDFVKIGKKNSYFLVDPNKDERKVEETDPYDDFALGSGGRF